MPRSNSEKSSDGSLTSEDEAIGPTATTTLSPPHSPVADRIASTPNLPRRTHLSPNDFVADADSHSQQNLVDAEERPKINPLGASSGGGLGKWRASANRVMQMNRSAGKFAIKNTGPGAEPGADPRRPSAHEHWSHIHEECSIQIVDYSDKKATFLKADNQGLIRFLTTREGDRPSWSKVRWINIGGISWDVISTIALEYDLHPLAVEDVLHSRRTSMSKADYYSKHLFISTLSHSVQDPLTAKTVPADPSYPSSVLPGITKPITASPQNTMYAHSTSELPPPATAPNNDSSDPRPNWLRAHLSSRQKSRPEGHIQEEEAPPPEPDTDDGVNWIFESIEGPENKKVNGHVAQDDGQKDEDEYFSEAKKQAADIAFLNELKGEDRVLLEVSNLYIFFLRDGTVITIYKKAQDGKVFGAPLLRRLRSAHMLMRRSNDPSLLLQGILDYVVDKALEIVDRYHDRILRLERSILIHPKMTVVRELHVLSGDLTLHKRTLGPIKSLIYGMRRYDLDRCKALVVSSNPNADQDNVKGYLSHQAKIYLADVNDHMDYILESMDMFGTIAENLISFTFNTISYQTNESMRRLSLATIIFFPLTFLTGYFGMNFVRFNGVQLHSDLFFWEITIPVMFVFIVGWTWHDLQRMFHVIKKRAAERRYTLAHRMRTSAAKRKTT